MLTVAEARNLLLIEREARRRAKRKELEPLYDWYGPPCGCPATREDGSCPVHHRARENQRPPTDPDWLVWMCLAGRGWGKTRTGAEWLIHRAQHGPKNGRYALIGQTAKDVREVMVEGESGIKARCPSWFEAKYNKTHGVIKWPNGSQAFCFSSEEPGQLRGPQFHDFWADELAKWSYVDECWSNLKLANRLGINDGHTPRGIVTTTPLPLPLIKRLLADTFRTRVSRGSTFDNAANLAESYITDVKSQYDGTRLGQQELYAEILDDTPGALWKHDWIERDRVKPEEVPELVRIVVAIDPPAADPKFRVYDEDKRAEAGITVGGIGEDGHKYLLEDLSMSGSPTEWATVAIDAYHRHMADVVVAEVNNGGAMIEAVLRSVDPSIPYKQQWASRGKQTRAEPIATQYERGEIHHVGRFPTLEAQLCSWVQGAKSPDRLDSLVWLMTELSEGLPAVLGENPFRDWRG